MQLPDLTQVKEDLLELADIFAAAVVKVQRPLDDEISTRMAYAEFGKQWLEYQLKRRRIQKVRLGPHKNSRAVFSRLELLAVREAERRNIYAVRTRLDEIKVLSGPGKPHIRVSLLWDLCIDKIEWDSYKRAIIHRVLNRGNEREKREIARFYSIPYKELYNYALTEMPYQAKLEEK